MPRRRVQFVPGGYYHIYNRGADRISICRNHGNYVYLLGLMKKYLCQFEITMIAHCLLPNHYHWLIRQDGKTAAGKLPQHVLNAYTKAFNKAEGRSGTLFADRYQAIAVETEPYLQHLCRYIHANAVRHGLAMAPELWPYSNYQEWMGSRPGTLVDRTFIKEHFDTIERYVGYVDAYLKGTSQPPRGLEGYLNSL